MGATAVDILTKNGMRIPFVLRIMGDKELDNDIIIWFERTNDHIKIMAKRRKWRPNPGAMASRLSEVIGFAGIGIRMCDIDIPNERGFDYIFAGPGGRPEITCYWRPVGKLCYLAEKLGQEYLYATVEVKRMAAVRLEDLNVTHCFANRYRQQQETWGFWGANIIDRAVAKASETVVETLGIQVHIVIIVVPYQMSMKDRRKILLLAPKITKKTRKNVPCPVLFRIVAAPAALFGNIIKII
ncbi:hypothetical protein TetV_351 [Tetraselmis virus 1]|uniref:Uncharacterized protein n=1 Tax=Tetraselmis virus 1 TaxID=2060617 RepID=A0A2P0VNG6_9VIRU|nr:hypothetical protein QJ968_gp351 [Tetraselmis virus 1]AUF82443.1 hypothetical protein TetV_351 [Tetraselmis virus 1]